MNFIRKMLGIFGMCLVLSVGVAQADTITMIVGKNPGGGADLQARFFAKHLEKMLGVQVIVKNLPGAGGLKALSFLRDKAKPDGLTLAFDAWSPYANLLGLPQAPDYSKLEILYANRLGPVVVFRRSDTAPDKKLKYGALSKIFAFSVTGRNGLDLLGIEYDFIVGYRGGAKLKLALLGKEINLTDASFAAWKTQWASEVSAGIVKPWFYIPYMVDGVVQAYPGIEDIPTVFEVAEQMGVKPSGMALRFYELNASVYGAMSMGILAPPGMSEDTSRRLSETFYKMAADPAFVAEFEEQFGTFESPPLSVVKGVLKTLDNLPPDLVQYMRIMMSN